MSDKELTIISATEVKTLTESYDIRGNPERYSRLGMILITVGLGGFLLWTGLAKLDEGTPAPATLVVASQAKSVQHLTGGIVHKVHVTEGAFIKQGDIILEIDRTQSQANFESALHQWYALLATQARLNAEKNREKNITFPNELTNPSQFKFGNLETANKYIALQTDLFNSRQLALNTDLNVLAQSIIGIQAEINGMQAQQISKKNQAAIINTQLEKSRQLTSEGYLPLNKLNEEERLASDMNAQILNTQADLLRLNSNLAEAKAKQEQRLRDFRRDVETQLADISNQVASAKERVLFSATDLERTMVRAPVTGQVIGLEFQSSGGVIAPGMRIANVIPSHEEMLLDAHIPIHLIDRIQPGMLADIRFHGLTDFKSLSVEGEVKTVSTDQLIDEHTRSPYYLARVAITNRGMKTLEHRHIQAGMQADLMIITRERTALQYLLEPLTRRITSTMREH